MSNWSGGIMTAAGRALQAKVEAGTKLELTHVKLGDGTETGDAVDELTDLVGGKAVLGISSTTVKDSLCTVTSVILTENVSTGFWAREWGLFAKDPDEGEILYMISLDPNPEFVPPSTAAVKQSATYAMSIAVSNAANIAVKIDPEGLTTNEMLAAAACLVERDKAYTVGERLYTPTLRRGLLLQCTKAGTTADTMLDCSTAELSDTITDGGVTWTVVKYALTTDVPPLASALATPRKIELTGNVTGSADFDGSKDIQIATSLSDVYLPLAGGEVTGTVNFKGGATGNWTGTVRGGNVAFEDKIIKSFDSKKDQSLDFIFNCNIHNYPVYLVSVGTMFYRNTGSSQRFINFGVAALYPGGWDINWLYSKENHNFIDYVGSTYAITVKNKAPLTINVSWKAQSQDSSTVFATTSVWVKSIGE